VKTYFIIASALTALFWGSSTTYAASSDFIDHGTYTTDSLSGFDWLDLTISAGQTYDYVSTQFGSGGEYEGWRYATGEQFNTLVSNYTGNPIPQNRYSRVAQEINLGDDLIDGLVVLLGSTLDVFWLSQSGKTRDASMGFSEGEYLDFTEGYIADTDKDGKHFVAMIHDFDEAPTSSFVDYSQAHFQTLIGNEIGFLSVGSYLIRDTVPQIPSEVPIPAAAILFAPGLLGFLGFRRKIRV
jgi:hypothetical protein